MHESVNDIGARLIAKFADHINATAGGSGDNSVATGEEIDRYVAGKGLAMSAKLIAIYSTTLTSDKTLSLTAGLTSCATSGGGYSSATSLLAKTAIATATTDVGIVEIDIDLAAYERYLKTALTPDLSADNTDVAEFYVALVLGGFSGNPVSATV